MEFQRLAAKESTNKSTHYQSFNLSEAVPAPNQIFRILQILVLTFLMHSPWLETGTQFQNISTWWCQVTFLRRCQRYIKYSPV